MRTKYISWSDVKVMKPLWFDLLVYTVIARLGVCREDAFDVLDEDWSFQLTRSGVVVALDEHAGRVYLLR